MMRSRVTFATIEAAAMLAATVSPFLMPSEGQGILLKRGAGLRESDPIEVQFYDARAGARVTRVEPYAPGADEETP